MWSRLKEGGKRFYDDVRDRFNESGDPCDFFFLLRTCRIGFVRFNRRGRFMVAYHRGANGLPPKAVKRLIAEWHTRLRDHDVQFSVRDYRTVTSKPGDFLYLDPPYAAETCRLYFGRFDHQQFFEWVREQRGGYAISLNGFVGDEDRRLAVPDDLYDEQMLIDNGTSPLRRMNGGCGERMRDSLYVRQDR